MYRAAMQVIAHTGHSHQGTVILFHGSGSSGEAMKAWMVALLDKYSFPHLRMVFPTAPLQPYTAAGGARLRVWFDRERVAPDAPERYDTINRIEKEVRRIIKSENEMGIPSNRIIVGGFSMGGALAYHAALRWERGVAGAIVFNAFLNDNSIVYQELDKRPADRLPVVRHVHGAEDEVVPAAWGARTAGELRARGVPLTYTALHGVHHTITKHGADLFREHCETLIPCTLY